MRLFNLDAAGAIDAASFVFYLWPPFDLGPTVAIVTFVPGGIVFVSQEFGDTFFSVEPGGNIFVSHD